ncbi:MAG TPA: hypothetical protein PK691_11090, partial [Thermomicrobiales bacterium]|nr:hypothetical protein [Thermomicrobiales bacterium]
MQRPTTDTLDEQDLFDLTCPGCNADLLADPAYHAVRICSACNRHFWISARERLAMLQKMGTTTEFSWAEPIVSALDTRERLTAADRIQESRDRSVLEDALITGEWHAGPIGKIAVIMLDPVLLGEGLGILATDKLCQALAIAIERAMPVVIWCAGGSRSPASGLVGAAQSLRLLAAITRLHRAGLPLIAFVSHGTGGNVLESIVTLADIRIAEPDVELPAVLAPDITIGRMDQIRALGDLLMAGLGSAREAFRLAPTIPGLQVSLAPEAGSPRLEITVQTNEAAAHDLVAPMRRALQISAELELPVLLNLTGDTQVLPSTLTSISSMLAAHSSPVVILLHGRCTKQLIGLLAGDAVLGAADLQFTSPRGMSFTLAEAIQCGIVDNPDAVEIDNQIAAELVRVGRVSPARRVEQRLRAMDQRGANTSAMVEAATLEILTLHEVQENVRRTFEDWRNRFEQRD